MLNFLDGIFSQLQRSTARVMLGQSRGEHFVRLTGRELLDQVQFARAYLRGAGFQPGDRCALLAPNSIRWIAFDLALMAEGIIVVPLYSRQAPADLAATMKDCQPRLLFVGDAAQGEAVAQAWPDAPPRVLFDEVLRQPASRSSIQDAPNPRSDADTVTIIYTSGTSGEPKGVCLNVCNLTHMLACTNERLDQLMGQLLVISREPDRVFHYLPFNFAASWILVLTCLSRESVLTLSTDLNRLPDKIRLPPPNYFLNFPPLLHPFPPALET